MITAMWLLLALVAVAGIAVTLTQHVASARDRAVRTNGDLLTVLYTPEVRR